MIAVHASILEPGQQARLEALARELTPTQIAWASGYLAGLVAQAAASTAAQPAAAARRPVTVLFGSETGNAGSLAARIGRQLTDRGVDSQVVSMGEYKPRNLKDEQLLIVVTATHGEGDPPESARGFFEFLMGRKAPKLEGLRYAVLGLGDSSYEHFCKAARDIDARLEQLGAQRIHARADCDVDFEATAGGWIEALTPQLATLAVPALPAALEVPAAPPPPGAPACGPASATVLDLIRLNGRGSDKTTCHVEFDVSAAGLQHQPGDSLGIAPANDPALVAELVEQLGLSPDESLERALHGEYELTVLTPGFIEGYARAGDIEPLVKLCADKDRTALRRYMENRQILDVVRAHPLRGLPAGQFTALLRKLEPRLYSIASSAAAAPGEIHITVAEVSFASPLAQRLGTASGQLCRRTEPGASFQVHVERNEQFRLPEDPQTPLIMIGAGTGVAPYRAFMQEREARGARGRTWLFFGERRFRTDFLYQGEWQQYLREGWLTRLDLAFSRDQERKIYVQDRLRERGRELYGWLQEGACLYVCGDAKSMAPDVQAALVDIVATHGGRDAESAREYLNDLTLERRYRRDVY